jgi:hypothetical protein
MFTSKEKRLLNHINRLESKLCKARRKLSEVQSFEVQTIEGLTSRIFRRYIGIHRNQRIIKSDYGWCVSAEEESAENND